MSAMPICHECGAIVCSGANDRACLTLGHNDEVGMKQSAR